MTASPHAEQLAKVTTGAGFFAALDQSGGSTPKALAAYGIAENRYGTDAQMFDLVHAMRTRVMTNKAFDGSHILGSILFEQTMEREVQGRPSAAYLWDVKQIVPFLKVDLGLADQANGVQLMRPLDGLDELLDRAKSHGIFGTKMRSVIHTADERGIGDVVAQQFETAQRILAAGLVPILEPEVSIDSPSKAAAEAALHDGLIAYIAGLPDDARIMLKLTLPTVTDLYADLAADPRVLRVLALSGGYERDDACRLLTEDHSMIASFSRALLDGLRHEQSDEQFGAQLAASVEQIYRASTQKTG